MQPIADFFAMVDARTLRATEKHERVGRVYFLSIVRLLGLLFILSLTSSVIIFSKVNSTFAAFGAFYQHAC
jgi:hypothetical protein